MSNYEYAETKSRDIKPEGEGWEYWSDRIVKDDNGVVVEHVAVWRRTIEEVAL